MAWVLEPQIIPRCLDRHLYRLLRRLQFHVLPNRNKFHFRGNHPFTRIVQLRDGTRFRTSRLSRNPRKLLENCPSRTRMTIVLRTHRTTHISLRIPPFLNPRIPQRRQPSPHISMKIQISPRSTRVIHPHWLIRLEFSIGLARGLQLNLAKWNF